MSDPHAKKADPHAKKEEGKSPIEYGIYILAAIALIIMYVSSGDETNNNEKQSKQQSEKSSNQRNYSKPAGTPKSFTISSDLSDAKSFTDVSGKFEWVFICDEPYDVFNMKGEKFHAEAHQQPNIGWSTANYHLRFKTTNGSTTEMKVEFTPKTSN